jgi:hypothetical protein
MKGILIFIFFSSLVFCTSEKSNEELLLGEWNAFWETSGDGFDNLAKEDLTMNGVMLFDETGIVTIKAYGHDGCIFSADTLTHQLNWRIEGEVLRFVDQKDDQGLPYNIQRLQENEVKLKLLEDIYLTLSK